LHYDPPTDPVVVRSVAEKMTVDRGEGIGVLVLAAAMEPPTARVGAVDAVAAQARSGLDSPSQLAPALIELVALLAPEVRDAMVAEVVAICALVDDPWPRRDLLAGLLAVLTPAELRVWAGPA